MDDLDLQVLKEALEVLLEHKEQTVAARVELRTVIIAWEEAGRKKNGVTK